jgi:hypothetical protein
VSKAPTNDEIEALLAPKRQVRELSREEQAELSDKVYTSPVADVLPGDDLARELERLGLENSRHYLMESLAHSKSTEGVFVAVAEEVAFAIDRLREQKEERPGGPNLLDRPDLLRSVLVRYLGILVRQNVAFHLDHELGTGRF